MESVPASGACLDQKSVVVCMGSIGQNGNREIAETIAICSLPHPRNRCSRGVGTEPLVVEAGIGNCSNVAGKVPNVGEVKRQLLRDFTLEREVHLLRSWG